MNRRDLRSAVVPAVVACGAVAAFVAALPVSGGAVGGSAPPDTPPDTLVEEWTADEHALCDVLDPQLAADAAGIELDDPEPQARGQSEELGFAVHACIYADGALVLTTYDFESLDVMRVVWHVLVTDRGGTVHADADLGELPETALATTVANTTTVAVFEAPVPFSVALSGGEVAAAVAAAEALYLDQAHDD